MSCEKSNNGAIKIFKRPPINWSFRVSCIAWWLRSSTICAARLSTLELIACQHLRWAAFYWIYSVGNESHSHSQQLRNVEQRTAFQVGLCLVVPQTPIAVTAMPFGVTRMPFRVTGISCGATKLPFRVTGMS